MLFEGLREESLVARPVGPITAHPAIGRRTSSWARSAAIRPADHPAPSDADIMRGSSMGRACR